MKKLILSALTFICFAVATYSDVTDLIFNHRIAVGMTWQDVGKSWGDPSSVDRVGSPYGVTEYWFYRSGDMVVIENGRVASWVTASNGR